MLRWECMEDGTEDGEAERKCFFFFLNLHDSLWSGGRLQLSLLKLYERN